MPRRNAKKAPTGIGFAETLTISGDSDVQEKYVRLMSWMGEHAGRAGTVRRFDTSAPAPPGPPTIICRLIYQKKGVSVYVRCQGSDAPDLTGSGCFQTPCGHIYAKYVVPK